MKKVYIEYGSMAYTKLFQELGFEAVYAHEAADIICFTGGSDVSPSIYGDAKHPTTMNDSFRDQKEAKLFAWAIENGKKMVGICRGGQFLNCMSGGRMYQHVSMHAVGAGHNITDLETGEVIYVSSTHHQMMMPGDGAILIATANLNGQREWYEGQVFKRDISPQDIEVVYYEHTGALCFQPHPEFNYPEYTRMKAYFRTLLARYLGV